MPKYRVLTAGELQELEKEFVDYLVVNGIVADEWEKIKKESPEKAGKIIELFSDVVFESVLRKIEFLEFRTRGHLFCYQCLPQKLVLIGMQGDEETDFTSEDYIKNALQKPPAGIEIISTEKEYKEPREEELFMMLDHGHVISDGKLFKALALVLADK